MLHTRRLKSKFFSSEKGSKNITPLHVAARYDQVRIALYLLRNGKNFLYLSQKVDNSYKENFKNHLTSYISLGNL